MTEQVATEIWREIKRYINPSERADAADTVISVMVDHDCDIDDIRAACAIDADLKRALNDYLDQSETEPDDYQEDEDDQDSWD